MKRILILFSFFIPVCIFAQIDSLKNVLKHNRLNDAEKASLYIELSVAYWNMQLDSSKNYADKAYQLAEKIGSQKNIVHALLQKAMILTNENQNQKAMQILRNGLLLSQKNNLAALEAEIYKNIGQTFKNEPDSSLLYYGKSISLAKSLGLNDLIIKNKIRISLILLHQKRHQELALLFDEILPELQKAKDIDGLIETYTYMSLTFRDLGDKEKSLQYADRAINLTHTSKNRKLKSFVLGAIASGIISYFETFEKAKPLLDKSIQLARELNDQSLLRNNKKRMAFLHFNNDEIDKAKVIIDSLLINNTDPDIFKLKGVVLHDAKKYTEANIFYNKAYQLYAKDKAFIQQKLVLLDKIDSKISYLGEDELMTDFKALDSITNLIHDTESKNQFFDLETKYRTAEKEAKIQQKELELTKSKNRIILISGVAILAIGAGFFGVWFLRVKQRRSELEHANNMLKLQNNLNATELANLNNQLNPHEIKNLITSIAPELLTKAPEAYKKMIRLFNVTRASLSNKITEDLITQLKQIEDYLLLQQSISPYSWTFDIDNQVEGLDIELPRLILKNLVENAVKYGIKSAKDSGEIHVILKTNNEQLIIQILDNGLEFNEDSPIEGTGIGLSTYQKFFEYSNKQNVNDATLTICKDNQWTKSEIILPLNYNYPN